MSNIFSLISLSTTVLKSCLNVIFKLITDFSFKYIKVQEHALNDTDSMKTDKISTVT